MRVIPIEEWRDEVPDVVGTPPINPNVFGPAAPIPAACEPRPTSDLRVDYLKVDQGVLRDLKRPGAIYAPLHPRMRKSGWDREQFLRQRDEERRQLRNAIAPAATDEEIDMEA